MCDIHSAECHVIQSLTSSFLRLNEILFTTEAFLPFLTGHNFHDENYTRLLPKISDDVVRHDLFGSITVGLRL